MAQWFLVRDGKEQGPFDDVQLRKLAADGILNPSDIVRRDGSAKGGPAKKIKGLFSLPTSADKKRPPAPPSRLGVSTTMEPAVVATVTPPPMPAAPSQNGSPTFIPAVQKESRLNPNVTFILGIWVGLGLSAAAFTGLAITGRFSPLVAWLETAAQKEAKEQEQAKPESSASTAAEVSKPDADGGTKEADDLPPAPGTLTAEFYPYHDGVRQQWDINAYLPKGTEWLQSDDHTYIGNGIIRSIRTKHLGKVDGKTIDMLAIAPKAKEPRDEHYRQKAGFIETADDEKDPDKMIWKPLMKLGAKPGDEWEDAHGFEKFKLLRFENRQLSIKGLVTTGDVSVAVIEESLTGL